MGPDSHAHFPTTTVVVLAVGELHFQRGAHQGPVSNARGAALIADEKPLSGRFAGIPCPVCGELFAKSGLPNHIRRHVKLSAASSSVNGTNRKSPAWWEGWKEGYKVGMHDGRIQQRKRASVPGKKTRH